MKRVAMLQSNYIPWKGVFDLISRVDVFVFYDDVQYTKKDWRSRNKIPTKNGELWLSVPVITKGRFDQLVCEAEIDRSTDWQSSHKKTLTLNYSKAPFFNDYRYLLDDFYSEHSWTNLSEMNRYITEKLARVLGLKTQFVNGPELQCSGSKEGGKVLAICEKLSCDWFLNGPASKAFMDDELFEAAGVELHYMNYEYPRYRQLCFPFDHFVSVLDLIFNTGPGAPYYIWGWRGDPKAQADKL